MEAFVSGRWGKTTAAEVVIGGAWRTIRRGEAYYNGQWRDILSFSSPLSLTATPSTTGSRSSFKPTSGNVTTEVAQASPVGGTGPYSYFWQILYGEATINTQGKAGTSFTAFLPANSDRQATARVTCTDSLGATASALVDIYFYNESDF